MSYQDLYQQSIEQPEVFWRKQAELIKWYEFPETILSQDEQFAEIQWVLSRIL